MHGVGEGGLECMVWGVAHTAWCGGGWLTLHVGEGGLHCMVWGRVTYTAWCGGG